MELLLFTSVSLYYTLYHWTPRNSTKVEGPWVFIRVISYPLAHRCLDNKSRVVATFYLLGTNPRNIDIMDQCEDLLKGRTIKIPEN